MIFARGQIHRYLLSAALALVTLGAAPAGAAAAPLFELEGHHGPTNVQAGSIATYTFLLRNIGDSAAEGPITLDLNLSGDMKTREDGPFTPFFGSTISGHLLEPAWDCGEGSTTPGAGSISCTFALGDFQTGRAAVLTVFVAIDGSASGPQTVTATASGGGAATVVESESADIGPDLTVFGIPSASYEADAFDVEGVPERQAGAHPFRAAASFDFNMKEKVVKDLAGDPKTAAAAAGAARNIPVTLPRGFSGNPNAVEKCAAGELLEVREQGAALGTACPIESQIGTIDLAIQNLDHGRRGPSTIIQAAVYNMIPPKGTLADFAFSVAGRPVHLMATLDPRDYSVVVTARNVNASLPADWQQLELWGVPADRGHDGSRLQPEGTVHYGTASPAPRRPFISLPTECGVPDTTDLTANSWEDPSFYSDPVSSAPVTLSGCDQLEFDPTIAARPTTNVADAPTGLEFDLHIPQNEDPDGFASAHLRDAVVTLPAGMTVNPPSADGLGACSMAEVGISPSGAPVTIARPGGHDETPVRCPESAKIGSIEASSPAVDHPLPGSVYLAEQNANPFGSLLAMYLVIDDPESGVLVKLPDKVDADPATGQLTATFRNNPQLPVEDIRLDLKQGPRAPLKTPASCGSHTTNGTMTPWSSPEGADVSVTSSFELTQGPAGGACLPTGGAAPNNPSFSAGTLDPTAKAFSPFVLKLSRADGTQQIKSIDTTLPKGLVAKLAGTTYCSDAALASAAGRSGQTERASASCPASSRVGSVNVGAGAGSTPLYVQGQAYLAGPYKGAPLSLAIITPATAGPFDLGTVVVRSALHVNSETAQVRAVSDEVPTILQGIPLNIRSVALQLDRPEFTLNPTSCNPMSIDGSALSVFDQSAPLNSRFQLGECNRLGFKPSLVIKLKGDTKRGGHPALTATVKTRPNDANIAKTIVALPHSEFLAQDHIRTICTRVQFAADACPAGSVYGTATAITPLLDEPLSGNVYLRSSSNSLPDMVIALRGKIDVDLVGIIDSDKRGGIRTSFETVPDAPVSSFTLKMAGGKKSLLENSKNLCRSVNKATAQMEAQNGMALDSRPVVKSAGCKKARGGKARKGGKKGKGGKKRGGR